MGVFSKGKEKEKMEENLLEEQDISHLGAVHMKPLRLSIVTADLVIPPVTTTTTTNPLSPIRADYEDATRRYV